ncbi:MAG TPA: tetratricopeptide repeat protein [Thermoanaerobaculia bacterium]|nr:tetratricopeptide repeat protein [Thermoanaerobaculia bacterium]
MKLPHFLIWPALLTITETAALAGNSDVVSTSSVTQTINGDCNAVAGINIQGIVSVGNCSVTHVHLDSTLRKSLEEKLTKQGVNIGQQKKHLEYLEAQLDGYEKAQQELANELKLKQRQSPTPNLLSELRERSFELQSSAKLDEAGAALNLLIDWQEQDVDRVAESHFRAALLADERLDWKNGVSHYAKAYQYRQDNIFYASGYLRALAHDDQSKAAEQICDGLLLRLRPLAKNDVKAYGVDLVIALQIRIALDLRSLAIAEIGSLEEKNRQADFVRHSQEQMDVMITQVLASPDEYELPFAMLLLKMARDTVAQLDETSDESEKRFETFWRKVLEAYRPIAKKNHAYDGYIATALLATGFMALLDKDYSTSAQRVGEAVVLLRRMPHGPPRKETVQKLFALNQNYEKELSSALFFLGIAQAALKQRREAEKNLKEGLAMTRVFVKANWEENAADLAGGLDSLASLYFDQGRWPESRTLGDEAIEIYNKLVRPNDYHSEFNLRNAYILRFRIAQKLREPADRSCSLLVQAWKTAGDDLTRNEIRATVEDAERSGFCSQNVLRMIQQ